MKKQFLEAGQIVNTHGIRGEVRITPWADSPQFLCQFSTFYIDGHPVRVLSSRPHKTMVLALLDGTDTVEKAMTLKGKVISIDRSEVVLPKGRNFLADLMGLDVFDTATGEKIGIIEDILTPPAHNVYVVSGGAKHYMIPAVSAFVAETDVDAGFMKVNLIEGLGSDV